MLNLFDSHTHSDNSPDGEHSVTFMCEKAVESGLMGIAVTDHCEIDSFVEGGYELRILQSVFEARKARVSFGSRLMITAGIELGQPLSDPALARKAVGLQNYDFVLGSVHAIRGCQDFYFMDYSKMTEQDREELLSHYFAEVLETVRMGGFDSLAHLTYPLRYMIRDGVSCELSRHQGEIDAVLKALISSGIALELNTANLEKPSGISPGREILKRYRELGGEYLTVGSDAHRADQIGYGITEGMRILEECGFRYFAFYKNRSPRMLKIC